MSYNLITACHKCKVQIFHSRGNENDLILKFYIKHAKCAKEDLNNVQTVMYNNCTDQDWQNDEEYGGYKKDKLK